MRRFRILLAVLIGSGPLAVLGCGDSSQPTIAPGTDDRAKEQKEVDDLMQKAGEAYNKKQAKKR